MEDSVESVARLNSRLNRKSAIDSLASNMPLAQKDIELLVRYCIMSSYRHDECNHDILTAIEGLLPLLRVEFLSYLRDTVERYHRRTSDSSLSREYLDLVSDIDKELSVRV